MSLLGKEASLNSLRVFETSARHLSFTAAARELRSTQSAVSQQIRNLEEQLGFALFERIYRGIKLTKAGHELFAGVQGGEMIDRTIDRLKHQNNHLHVTILADFSFAAYWLMFACHVFAKNSRASMCGSLPIKGFSIGETRKPTLPSCFVMISPSLNQISIIKLSCCFAKKPFRSVAPGFFNSMAP